jgi:hypothetical protein
VNHYDLTFGDKLTIVTFFLAITALIVLALIRLCAIQSEDDEHDHASNTTYSHHSHHSTHNLNAESGGSHRDSSTSRGRSCRRRRQ